MTQVATATPTVIKPWSCPDSTLILKADAERAEWLKWRKGGIGGSDAASLMGDNPYDDGTPFFVWQDKTSDDDPEKADKRNKAMERGQMMEGIVRKKFEEQTGLTTRRQGLHQSKSNPVMIASVDALASDGGGLECKTATTWAIKKWPVGWDTDNVCPPLYAWQAKHYMKVTGRRHWWIACLIIDTWTLVVWRIDWDDVEDDMNLLEVVETEFWNTHVVTGVPPEFDEDHFTNDEIAARWPSVVEAVIDYPAESEKAQEIRDLVITRRALAQDKKDAEEEYDDISSKLKAIAQGYEEVRVDGKKVFTMKMSGGKGRVTNDQILVAYPDVDLDKCRVKSTGRTLYVDQKVFK